MGGWFGGHALGRRILQITKLRQTVERVAVTGARFEEHVVVLRILDMEARLASDVELTEDVDAANVRVGLVHHGELPRVAEGWKDHAMGRARG